MEFCNVWSNEECVKATNTLMNLKLKEKMIDDVDFDKAVDIVLSEIYSNVGDRGWNSSNDVRDMISRVCKKRTPYRTTRTRVFLVKDEKFPNFINSPFWILNSIVRIDGDNEFVEVNRKKFKKINIISSKKLREKLKEFTKVPLDFFYRSGVLEFPRNLTFDKISEKDLVNADNLNLTENDIIWVEFKRSLYLESK